MNKKKKDEWQFLLRLTNETAAMVKAGAETEERSLNTFIEMTLHRALSRPNKPEPQKTFISPL